MVCLHGEDRVFGGLLASWVSTQRWLEHLGGETCILDRPTELSNVSTWLLSVLIFKTPFSLQVDRAFIKGLLPVMITLIGKLLDVWKDHCLYLEVVQVLGGGNIFFT